MDVVMIGALAAFLLLAAWQDIAHRRIPNLVVFLGAGVGIGLHAADPLSAGVASAFTGWGIGLLALLPLYLLRVMGAGDAKLMAMVGAFLGFPAIVGAVLVVLLAGGLLSLWYAVRAGVLGRVLGNLRLGFYLAFSKLLMHEPPTLENLPVSAGRFPYGVAIALGTFTHLAAQYAGLGGWY